MTNVFASALISMEEIEPNLGSRVKFGEFVKLGIRQRVSYPFLLYVMYTSDFRVILTLIPIRAVYQTSAGMASVGNGRLRMRRPASLSTVSTSYVHIRKFSTRYTETRAGWGV